MTSINVRIVVRYTVCNYLCWLFSKPLLQSDEGLHRPLNHHQDQTNAATLGPVGLYFTPIHIFSCVKFCHTKLNTLWNNWPYQMTYWYGNYYRIYNALMGGIVWEQFDGKRQQENESSRLYLSHFIEMFLDLFFVFCFFLSVEWNRRIHDDVIKWKHFPRYWSFVWGIRRSPVNSPHLSQWRGAFVFCLIFAWINGWVNNREAGALRRHRDHYDVIVMKLYGRNFQFYCFTLAQDLSLKSFDIIAAIVRHTLNK